MFEEVAKLKTDFTPVVVGEARKQFYDDQAKQQRAKVEADAKSAGKSKDDIAKALVDFDAAQATAAADRKSAYDTARAAFVTDFVTKAKAADAALADADATAQAEAAAKAHWEADYDNPLGSDALAAGVNARRELLNKTLVNASQVYKAVLSEVRRQLNVLPPSSAMAGVYTMVDNTRGVWKAPANVSLNGVISPTVSISAEQQEDLNVSAQGKSINAIRSFIGEGVLVWGARTLDGNSLDWRYINVRRTMIMLEESCRLAAKAMVFEPNTANTWVTIRSMIANFLTSVWKRGGLMGAVPEDAFAVQVGLGETMTPNDVLEGILRVTVLVAMVRPAEFIEITFQQQMPKS
jgi:phage tail sheath protein FI